MFGIVFLLVSMVGSLHADCTNAEHVHKQVQHCSITNKDVVQFVTKLCKNCGCNVSAHNALSNAHRHQPGHHGPHKR